jgi:hypothetical protein
MSKERAKHQRADRKKPGDAAIERPWPRFDATAYAFTGKHAGYLLLQDMNYTTNSDEISGRDGTKLLRPHLHQPLLRTTKTRVISSIRNDQGNECDHLTAAQSHTPTYIYPPNLYSPGRILPTARSSKL